MFDKMTKAYDLAALKEEAKKQGLKDLGAEGQKLVSLMTAFLTKSAELSHDGVVGKLDDFAIPGYKYFEAKANEQLAKLGADEAPPAA